MEEDFLKAKSLVEEKYTEEDSYYGVLVLGMYGILHKYPKYTALIQEVFRKTRIIIEEDIIVHILKKHQLSFEDMDEEEEEQLADRGHVTPAFSFNGRHYFIDRKGHFHGTKTDPIIVISGLIPSSFLLDTFMHEMNHLVKSEKNVTHLEQKHGHERYSIRSGLRVTTYEITPHSDDVDEMISYCILDETINTMQTAEMDQEVLALREILPEGPIKEFLRDCDPEDFEDNPMYSVMIEATRPLLQNPAFRSVVDDNLVEGNIKAIEKDFKAKAGEGSLLDLADLLDELDDVCSYSDDSEMISYIKKQIKAIVKRYIKNAKVYQK